MNYRLLICEAQAALDGCSTGLRESLTAPVDTLPPAVSVFRKKFDECDGKLRALINRATRSPRRNLCLYAAALETLQESFSQRCNQRLWETYLRHSEHCVTICKAIDAGKYSDALSDVIRTKLHEELATDAQDLVKQIGKLDSEMPESGPSEITDDLAKQHDAFVKALEKHFKISVHRWEPCREGLTVFLDGENTEELLAQLQSYNEILQQIAGEHDYLLIRRGTASDIDFGTFPCPTSRWVFISCASTVDNWDDPEEVLAGDKARTSEVEKLNKILLKGVNKLPLK